MYGHEHTADELRDFLLRSGFVECDCPACNCGSFHHRFGLPERMVEIREALTEAGHPPCNDNGNIVINALREALAALKLEWRSGPPQEPGTYWVKAFDSPQHYIGKGRWKNHHGDWYTPEIVSMQHAGPLPERPKD